MLTDVLAQQVIERLLPQRRREPGHGVQELGSPGREIGARAHPPEVEIQRLGLEGAPQARRQACGARPVEVSGRAIPGEGSVGPHDEEPGGRTRLQPRIDLLRHPLGTGGLLGREEDEEP